MALRRLRRFNSSVPGFLVLSVLGLIAGLIATDASVVLGRSGSIARRYRLHAVGETLRASDRIGVGRVGLAVIRTRAVRPRVGPPVRTFLTNWSQVSTHGNEY
jgi:hypothetical protein